MDDQSESKLNDSGTNDFDHVIIVAIIVAASVSGFLLFLMTCIVIYLYMKVNEYKRKLFPKPQEEVGNNQDEIAMVTSNAYVEFTEDLKTQEQTLNKELKTVLNKRKEKNAIFVEEKPELDKLEEKESESVANGNTNTATEDVALHDKQEDISTDKWEQEEKGDDETSKEVDDENKTPEESTTKNKLNSEEKFETQHGEKNDDKSENEGKVISETQSKEVEESPSRISSLKKEKNAFDKDDVKVGEDETNIGILDSKEKEKEIASIAKVNGGVKSENISKTKVSTSAEVHAPDNKDDDYDIVDAAAMKNNENLSNLDAMCSEITGDLVKAPNDNKVILPSKELERKSTSASASVPNEDTDGGAVSWYDEIALSINDGQAQGNFSLGIVSISEIQIEEDSSS